MNTKTTVIYTGLALIGYLIGLHLGNKVVNKAVQDLTMINYRKDLRDRA